MSLQAILWRSVIIPEMIVCWHPERIWRALCLLKEWTLKASRLFKADSMLLVKKGACAVAKDIVFCLEGEIDVLQNALLIPLWTCGSRPW